MKTKTEKILIAICILLAVILFLVLCAFAWHEGKEIYPKNTELYGDHTGRDFRGSVGYGKFFMVHVADRDHLLVSTSPDSSNFVLSYEYNHIFDDNDLYYYAESGYAVVYAKSNLCKVLLNDPIDKLEGDEYRCIVYLDSFDEFTPYEQKMLKSLE